MGTSSKNKHAKEQQLRRTLTRMEETYSEVEETGIEVRDGTDYHKIVLNTEEITARVLNELSKFNVNIIPHKNNTLLIESEVMWVEFENEDEVQELIRGVQDVESWDEMEIAKMAMDMAESDNFDDIKTVDEAFDRIESYRQTIEIVGKSMRESLKVKGIDPEELASLDIPLESPEQVGKGDKIIWEDRETPLIVQKVTAEIVVAESESENSVPYQFTFDAEDGVPRYHTGDVSGRANNLRIVARHH